ncbi:MAG: GFA family protein [Myxococcota bacterium]|nr:GFA family protein [Myxococcota bacterium]
MIEGGCYCGALRFQVEGDPLFQGQCHCRECQYISGGSPNVVMAFPEPGFRWTKGDPKPFQRSDLDTPVTREFCADCGTHLVSKAPGMPGTVILKPGTFDDPSVFAGPQMAIYTCDKQSFHHIPEGIATFERTPGG